MRWSTKQTQITKGGVTPTPLKQWDDLQNTTQITKAGVTPTPLK
jgi:hypothetical protein